jgi:predicted P-loop ATPase
LSKEVNQEEYAPRTIADVKEMLSKHSNGEIQRTIRNCELILQNDHVLANAIRLNLLSERIDIVKPVGWPRSGKALNDTDMKYILRRMEKYGISSEKKIESAIRIVANENRYHPIRDYLNSLKWDGTERIAHVLHHFLGAAEDDYTCEAMKIFLLGAIKRVFQPGCKFETMLCLVGGQGAKNPADRLRQCVFAGTTNRQDFLPRDRTGNRRFIPIPVDAELAEVHILDNEDESRAYIDQLWAEAMTIYNSGNYKLAFRPAMQETLQAHQQDFMQEDAQAGMIYAFLEDYAGDRVCSKQLYAEALGNTNIPAEWETRAICEIMNTGISRGDIQGWQAHKTAKRYPKYGVQKGWERVTSPETGAEDFSEITDAEAQQMGFPF